LRVVDAQREKTVAKYAVIVFGTLAVLVADQLTKLAVVARFKNRESLTLIDNLFGITFVGNDGAAFGLFSGYNIYFFLLVSTLAIGFILYFFWTVPAGRNILITALALILGGALGNLLDRVRLGYVVDFLDVHHKFTIVPYNFVWPKFNVADAAILIGVALFVVDMFKAEKQRKLEELAEQAEQAEPIPEAAEARTENI
jgi:signal peptidase II